MKLRRFTFAESGLDRFLSAHLSNRQYNRFVWTVYPLAGRLGEVVGVRRAARSATPGETELVGDEWGTPGEVRDIVREFIEPFVDGESVVAEIGVGGGRVAMQVAPLVQQFYCLDASSTMLRRARKALAGFEHVHYVKLARPACPAELQGAVNFVYAFDVFVHFDVHLIWKYFQAIAEMLTPRGKALVHVANLAAPSGWEKFSSQKAFSVGGLYFLSPEIVAILADRAGFSVLKESSPRPGNNYLCRDHVAVLEKRS